MSDETIVILFGVVAVSIIALLGVVVIFQSNVHNILDHSGQWRVVKRKDCYEPQVLVKLAMFKFYTSFSTSLDLNTETRRTRESAEEIAKTFLEKYLKTNKVVSHGSLK